MSTDIQLSPYNINKTKNLNQQQTCFQYEDLCQLILVAQTRISHDQQSEL